MLFLKLCKLLLSFFLVVQQARHVRASGERSRMFIVLMSMIKLCQFLVEMGMNTAPVPLNYRIKIDHRATAQLPPTFERLIIELQICEKLTFAVFF